MTRWVGVWLVLVGCGSVGGASDVDAAVAVDAAGADDGSTPAPDASVRCDSLAAFSEIRPALATQLVHSYSARLSPDELTMVFSGQAAGRVDYDVFISKRAAMSEAFGAPIAVAANSDANDWDPTLSQDQTLLIFGSTRAGAARLYVSERATVFAEFTSVNEIMGLGIDGDIGQPFLAIDDSELWFTGGGDIHVARRTSGGFGQATRVDELSSSADEWMPVLSGDGLTAYFASTLDAESLNIWRATRAAIDEPFSPPTAVSELTTNMSEAPSWLSADGCRLYFWRGDGAQSSIFVAVRELSE